MKRLFLLTGIIFVTIYACNRTVPNPVPEDYIEHTIELKNNLGLLTISLPPEFDTLYSWTHRGDNNCGHFEKFRFANKKYSLPQETGTFYFYYLIVDSLYQLTIIQQKNTDFCGDTMPKIDDKLVEDEVKNYLECYPDVDIFLKGIKTIQGRDFIVIGGIYDSKYVHYKVESGDRKVIFLSLTTESNKYPVELKFLCMAADCTDFINRVEKSLNSIKITPVGNSVTVEISSEN
ncbi:MAG: hypothetical protein FWH36_01050 [Lentimicrobiaceae bacterium]|nr:hypothetical protein [Lentimicrobiaceae bacterium]